MRLKHRHGRVNTVKAGFVTSGRNNAAFPAADNDRLMLQRRIIAFFNGTEKRIAINMSDRQAAQLWMGNLPITPASRTARLRDGVTAITAQRKRRVCFWY